jgi:hypothetical protein
VKGFLKLNRKAAQVAVCALALFAGTAQAVPIVGSIGFAGSYSQVGGVVGNLMTASSMQINTVFAINSTGQFGPLGSVVLNAFVSTVGVNGNLGPNHAPFFNQNTPSDQLWSITVGGVTTYTFTVMSESQVFTAANAIDLQGSALVSDGNPADNTAGTWTLNFGNSGSSFTWNSTSATVPDAGSTAMLLGGAMSIFGLLRKKLKA